MLGGCKMNFFSMLFLFLLSALTFSSPMHALSEAESRNAPNVDHFRRNLVLGNILKGSLENLHFNKQSIDDKLSVNAFQEYLKFLDYSKRFLTLSDIASLRIHEKKIDDQIISGRLDIINEAEKIMDSRVRQVRGYVEKRLGQPFKLETERRLELDSKKRRWQRNIKGLYELWDDILLVDIIGNYLDIDEEQNNPEKEKNKKSQKKKGKGKSAKMNPKEIEKEAISRTKRRYLRILDRMMKEDYNDRLNKLFNAVARIFDPHTQYLAPRDKEDFNISMSGSLEGIGAILREDGNYIKVVEIIPGSASWRGKKLKAEDVILKVGQGKKEPVDIVGMRVEDAVQLIRGKKGSEVRLTVRHGDGRVQTIPIIRDVVVIEESYVKYSTLKIKNNIRKFGYIQVPTFYRDFKKSLSDKTARNCTTDVANALKAFGRNVSGVILDLRNNGGGSLEDARTMSGLFVRKGPIVQVKNYEGRVDVLKDKDSSLIYDGPLVVLTNKFSASASEILASAMQDYGRAIVIGGSETHGKGTVQTLLDLDRYVSPPGALKGNSIGSLKLTVQKFYRINGGSTQFRGVIPDIILPDPLAYLKSGERHHDYALPWDELKPLRYTRWPKSLEIKRLRKASEKRVDESENFQNIVKSIKSLKENLDDTKAILSLKASRAKREKLKENRKIFEFDQINSNIVVSNVSLDQKLLNEDQKERKEEWVKSLKKDPYIQEVLSVLEHLWQLRSKMKS